MEITVNLAKRPFLDLRPILKWLRAGVRALTISTLALGLTTYFFHRKAENARSRVRAIEEKISSIRKERRAYQEMLRHGENIRIRREADSLNQIFDVKAFSWTLLMKDLEAVLPSDVQVTAIEPERAKDGTMTLHMHVLGPRDKDIEFLKNLEMSNRFLSPRIAGESPDNNERPNQKQGPANSSKSTKLDLLAEYDADSAEQPAPTPPDAHSVQGEANPAVQSHNSSRDGTASAYAVSRVAGEK
jgi:type IV pilus assembly protein PilN